MSNLLTDKKSALVYGIGAILILSVPLLFANIQYLILVACFVEIYAVAVSGLDILFGYSGQISMGHAAFFAIGAYGSVLIHKYFGIPVIATMLIGAILGGLIAAILAYPASKLVFHFLSLATIAFGEIIYGLLIHSPNGITGDTVGLYTKSVTLFGLKIDSYTRFYYFGLILLMIFLLAKQMIIHSKTGRAFIAIRENTHAADGMGINVRRYKIIAFAISGFYTAFAGAMYAHLTKYISPDTFTNKQSVLFITMLLFGGTGSLFGPIVGCIVLMSITELLRSAQNYMLLIYSVLMLIVIVALPGGLYGTVKNMIDNRRMKRQDLQTKGGAPNA